MKKIILAKKIGMTQVMDENNVRQPVTVLQVEDSAVIQIKTEEKDGYKAIVVGFGNLAEKKCNKPLLGIFKKNNVEPKKTLKEFRLDDVSTYKVGDAINIESFAAGDVVDVRGKTIGKGFQGTIVRWNFTTGLMTHGSKSHRIPGSSGSGTTPGTVVKGLRRAGHLGDEYQTIQNLVVIKVDKEKGLLLIKGAIPGKRNNQVIVTG